VKRVRHSQERARESLAREND